MLVTDTVEVVELHAKRSFCPAEFVELARLFCADGLV